mgnify:CR=1 FL=1
MYHVYVVQCADGTLYTGCTNNLKRRINQHNFSKKGAHYTKLRRPVILKYSEKFDTLVAARKREFEIKSWRKKEKLALFK